MNPTDTDLSSIATSRLRFSLTLWNISTAARQIHVSKKTNLNDSGDSLFFVLLRNLPWNGLACSRVWHWLVWTDLQRWFFLLVASASAAKWPPVTTWLKSHMLGWVWKPCKHLVLWMHLHVMWSTTTNPPKVKKAFLMLRYKSSAHVLFDTTLFNYIPFHYSFFITRFLPTL